MSKAILLKSDDWEGLYVDRKLVKEGHTLNEGRNRIQYFLELSHEYGFNISEMKEQYINAEDTYIVDKIGSFPERIYGFVGGYEYETS